MHIRSSMKPASLPLSPKLPSRLIWHSALFCSLHWRWIVLIFPVVSTTMCQLDDGAGSRFFFPPSETDGDGNDKESKVKLRTGMIVVSIFLFKQGCLKIVHAGLSKFHFRKTFATVSQRQIWVIWAEAETETAADKGKTCLAGCHCNQWISDPPPRYILEFIFQSVQAFSSLTQTNAHNCCYFLAAWGWKGNCNNSIHGGQLKPILALIPTTCVAHQSWQD